MIPTVPFDVALNIAIGASLAWAGKDTQVEGRVWRSAALGALLALEALVFLPVGAYLLTRYPDWSMMYLVDVSGLPPTIRLTVLALYPIAAVSAFVAARRLLKQHRKAGVAGLIALGIGLALAIAYVGQTALLSVGTAQTFAAGTARSLFETSLFYLLILGSAAVIASWGAALWRLRLVSAAAQRTEVETKQVGPSPKTLPPGPAARKKAK